MMTHLSFKTRLTQPAPILADGGMGTLLSDNGVPMEATNDSLNLSQPETVKALHRAYLEAGAELIETNTFGANRYKLMEHGLEDRAQAINVAGAKIAREAVAESGGTAYVAGSIGPLGAGLQPYGRIKPEDASAAFSEQITGLLAGGVDVLIFETFTDLAELRVAIDAAHKTAPALPIIAQMTFGRDDRTIYGYLPGRVARELNEAGVDVIGVNCSGGPAQITRVLIAMQDAVPDAKLSAMPNAGYPQNVGGRMIYTASADYFGSYARTFRGLGAAVIGGCCGTTPAHIAALRRSLDLPEAEGERITITRQREDDERAAQAPDRPSELSHRLATGQFVISVEMNPPRGHNFERLLNAARTLVDAGATVLNITDSPTARMRSSPWAACHAIEQAVSIETILHFPTRGRNMLRVQGDLLGAHALGLRNIFVCMGDPTRIGDYPAAMDNYDIVPSGLIKLAKQRLNEGIDQAGNSIGQPTSFTIGCALNMVADDLDKEIDVLRKKIANGADFALAQAVFDPAKAERFLRRYEQVEGHPLELPVLIGILPLYSLRHARFLNNEVPGIEIPEAIFKRIETAGEGAAQEGVRIAQELLRDLKDLARGAYIIPSFGHYDLAAQVVDAVGVAR
ncbi:MAG: methylenetetrahydrofolate reductase [Chloroflexi bacterium OLB15]|nr:MAG: methylenetetrahydrofolate reductase [Chloroflexi bacterium OLB15]